MVTRSSDPLGKAFRFIASRGMADEDADVVAELLLKGRQMADAILADDRASPRLREVATAFLDQLSSDAFAAY